MCLSKFRPLSLVQKWSNASSQEGDRFLNTSCSHLLFPKLAFVRNMTIVIPLKCKGMKTELGKPTVYLESECLLVSLASCCFEARSTCWDYLLQLNTLAIV